MGGSKPWDVIIFRRVPVTEFFSLEFEILKLLKIDLFRHVTLRKRVTKPNRQLDLIKTFE